MMYKRKQDIWLKVFLHCVEITIVSSTAFEKGVSGKVAFYKNLPVRLLFPLHHLILDISYDSFAVYNRASDTQKA